MTDLTRRKLLKLAGSAVGVAAALPLINVTHVYAAEPESLGAPPADLTGSEREHKNPERVEEHYLKSGNTLVSPPTPLGRIATWGVEIRKESKQGAKLVRVARRDELLRLYKQGAGEAVMPHNPIWYETDDGYAYSSWVQPVEDIKNIPEPERAAAKFWGEITVPFSDSRAAPDPKARRYMRLYYTGIFRIIAAVRGKDGQWWYRLQEGVGWGPGPYVPAAHVRRIDPSELTPISPEVKNKRIEVNLKEQTITAFENDHPILTSRVASGYGSFRTPSGAHPILFKNAASRMTGGTGNDFYDLPGVPFPTYITWKGVAIHGAYWHNDFGRPRSHGCLNVPAPVARWFWRWTVPSAPYEAAIYYTPKDVKATVVKVF
jgi:lipoprotein-anchoring transpeptidase ErfK/SrfK